MNVIVKNVTLYFQLLNFIKKNLFSCENNSTSKKCVTKPSFKQTTGLSFSELTVYTNSVNTLRCYKNHVLFSTAIIIRIEPKIFDQIVTSTSFCQTLIKCWNFGITGKDASCFLFFYSWNVTFLNKMQFFFREWSISSLKSLLWSG